VKAREKILRYDRSLDCVHCGLCLQACPTYKMTGRESSSPRGRIYLMRALAEGRLEETAENVSEIDACLVCRACEPVCPSGVQYGEMMELTRDLIETGSARARFPRWLKRVLFRKVLPHPHRLRMLTDAVGLLQWTGLSTVSRKLGIPGLFGRRTALRDAMAPKVPAPDRRSVPSVVSEPTGDARATVGFLVGCVAHELLPDANRAAISVLQRNGCRVICPSRRPCCGALAGHFGDLDAARRLARETIVAFESGPTLDAIVVSSAGCASAMKEYDRLFGAEPSWQRRAEAFTRKVQDFSEFLVGLPWSPPTAGPPLRVAYDEPCHLLHAQRIQAPPRRLLQQTAGLTLVPFTGQEDCCGAAGLYTLTEPESSMQLLETKMAHVREADPDVLVTANPGCQLQLRSGAAHHTPKVEVLHLAELLDRRYRAPPESPR